MNDLPSDLQGCIYEFYNPYKEYFNEHVVPALEYDFIPDLRCDGPVPLEGYEDYGDDMPLYTIRGLFKRRVKTLEYIIKTKNNNLRYPSEEYLQYRYHYMTILSGYSCKYLSGVKCRLTDSPDTVSFRDIHSDEELGQSKLLHIAPEDFVDFHHTTVILENAFWMRYGPPEIDVEKYSMCPIASLARCYRVVSRNNKLWNCDLEYTVV